ncbi:MAG: Unknown protein [uncultured Sulfurovum sp.]|uniref:PD-(D/E)XK nuclease superfamily protein n=1 Tax=uncultured Sulfurovum sp. TaxID=269237 RepID=A0A6S6SBC5_9BACT|nr:MAG: Unknown protein [uncultured Sulfurovum sp.]
MDNLILIMDEIKKRHQKHQQIKQDEASDFNVFSLLLKAGDEVGLHSKFIYELLNPHGSHGQGSLFLALFFEVLALEIPNDIPEAFREKQNIDILLQSHQQVFIIENKIHTQDHSFQLSRYVQTVQSMGYKKKNIRLIYLTLFGHAPTEQKLNSDVMLVSYRHHIVSWLEEAITHTKQIPILSETLKQYLNLVKILTHQSTQKGFINEMKDFLLEENNLQTILQLEAPIIEAKIEVQFNFWQMLLAHLMPHYAFSFYNTNNDKGLKKSIRRYYQQQKNIKDYGIKYQIEENLYFFIELRKNIYYGFEFMDEEKIEERQREALAQLNVSWAEVSNTIYWKYPHKRLNFTTFNSQNIFDLIKPKTREEAIKQISNEIIGLITHYQQGIKYV